MKGAPDEELAKPMPPDPNNYAAPAVKAAITVAGTSPKLPEEKQTTPAQSKPKAIIPPTMGQGVSDPVPVLIREMKLLCLISAKQI
jgi:hypothetical protein